MREIEVMAGPQDRNKILKRVTAFGKWVSTWSSVTPGGQVAGEDHQRADATDPFPGKRAELHAAAQVAPGIHHLRLPKVRVMADSPFAAEVPGCCGSLCNRLGHSRCSCLFLRGPD